MSDADRLEKIDEFLGWARELDGIWFVEGKEDVKALNSLGFEGVHPLNRGLPIVPRVDQLLLRHSSKTWFLLFDDDRKGHALRTRTLELLSGRCKVDHLPATRLWKLVQTPFVEEIPAEINGLRTRVFRPF